MNPEEKSLECPDCNEDLIFKTYLKRRVRLKRWICPKCGWNNPNHIGKNPKCVGRKR